MMMQQTDNHERDLRDEVARTVLSNMASEQAIGIAIANNLDINELMSSMVKVSFNFADTFMRERYERESVARASMEAAISKHYEGIK